MKKIKLVVLVVLVLLFLLPSKVLAVTISITSSPSTISSFTETFSVGVSVDGPNPGTNYLRVDIFKAGTTNYFSETFNGSSWYGSSDGLQYFPITISEEGTASATLQGRLGSPSTSEYIGPGEYLLRIRRYTASGNPASGDNETPVGVQISVATPSPSPTPTNTPTSTPTPTPSPTPTKTPTPTSKPTVKPAAKPLPTSNSSPSSTSGEELVLGLREQMKTTEPSASPSGEKNGFSLPMGFLPAILILGGIIFMAVPGYLFLKKAKSGYTSGSEENGENN